MGSIKTTVWPLDPHTKAKHIILQKYLDAWLPIISKYNGKVLYVDGFAGPGEYQNHEGGSPLIALKSISNHKLIEKMKAEFKFLFIERDKDRCNHLRSIVEKFPLPAKIKIDIEVRCGEFKDVFGGILSEINNQGGRLAPSFVFIDPFGFSGIPLDLISDIMSNKKCEVLITFMYEDIIRWLSLDINEPHLNSLFGTESWKEINSKVSDTNDKVIEFHNLYKSQLTKCAKIQFVRSFMMINKYNKPDYFLFFGTNSELGLEKMKEAMWKVDTLGAFQFSDATYDPKQAVLFEPTPKFGPLKRQILNKYHGKKVDIGDLETFVIQETEYLRSHIRKPILFPMEQETSPQIKVHFNGHRRKMTYPQGTIIEFV